MTNDVYDDETNFSEKAYTILEDSNSIALLYKVCYSTYYEVGLKERDDYKKKAVKAFESFSTANIQQMPFDVLKRMMYIVRGIGDMKGFSKFVPSEAVQKEQIIDELKKYYKNNITKWNQLFDKYIKQYECNTLQKYQFVYTLDKDNVLHMYAYLGTRKGKEYCQPLYNFTQFALVKTIELTRVNSLVEFFESNNGVFLAQMFSKRATRKPENIRPLNMRLNVEKYLMTDKNMKKKLEYYA